MNKCPNCGETATGLFEKSIRRRVVCRHCGRKLEIPLNVQRVLTGATVAALIILSLLNLEGPVFLALAAAELVVVVIASYFLPMHVSRSG